jgi:predicted Zn finger-like uncharacterized protein
LEDAEESAPTLAQRRLLPEPSEDSRHVIVTCEQCSTQFHLDDAKVPERGVRVRCSRCKHAFFVKPQPDAGDPVDRAVEQALDDAPVRAARPGPLDEGPEESDWEFNHEPGSESRGGARAAPAGADLAREAVDDLLGEAGDEMPDLDSVTAPGLDDDADSLPGDAPEDGGDGPSSGIELGGDLSEGLEEGPAEEPLGSGLELEESPFGEPGTEPDAPPAPVAEPGPDEATLGSPENWDFFDEPAEAPAPLPSTARIAIGRIGRIGRAGATPLRPPAEVDAEPGKAAVWLERLVHGVGWTAVSLLALVGFYGGLGPGRTPQPASAVPGVLRVAGLELDGVRGSWIDNAPGGPIYVVSGALRNPGASAVTPGARLTLQVLDARGKVLSADAAALGAALSVERLRTGRPQELRAELAEDAQRRAWAPLPPGASRDFHAVLAALPEGAARIQVVAQPVERPASAPPERPAAAATSEPS